MSKVIVADWARGRTALVGDASSCGGGNKAAVAFLRDALAQGPISAREIERRAVSAGLLEEGKPIGKSKVFRTARAALGAKSYQQPGQRAGGWIWSWDQAPVDRPPRNKRRNRLGPSMLSPACGWLSSISTRGPGPVTLPFTANRRGSRMPTMTIPPLIAALAVVFTVGVGIGICAVVGGHFILGWAIDRYVRREPQ